MAPAGPRGLQVAACTCVILCALSNPSLRELPAELGQLGNLWQLDTEDLNISNVPAEIRKEGKGFLSIIPLERWLKSSC